MLYSAADINTGNEKLFAINLVIFLKLKFNINYSFHYVCLIWMIFI